MGPESIKSEGGGDKPAQKHLTIHIAGLRFATAWAGVSQLKGICVVFK